MHTIILLYQYGPSLTALIVALIMTFAGRQTQVVQAGSTRLLTGIGLSVALLGIIAIHAWSISPRWIPSFGENGTLVVGVVSFLGPLVLCGLALLLLIFPIPTPGEPGSAVLARRTILTFTPRAWLITLTSLVFTAGVLAVLAGLASSPDSKGRYVTYKIWITSESAGAAQIYGWWFSIPCLITIALIAALVLTGLTVISRPPLMTDPHQDACCRSARILNIMKVATGGLLLHTGAILQSLAGTALLRVGVEASNTGEISFGSSFASLGPTLTVASYAAVIIGMAMWWSVLFSALTSRSLQTTKSVPA
ncbi:hypothetical protein V5R04_14165 [Jonesiaceae bacterium BS-20]|uniref:Uncharacterized protein n=1 Tax=Jonesiaceae bacterium BS-20 TaxID=3120821 RepID=A0AAU7DT42_9MICO